MSPVSYELESLLAAKTDDIGRVVALTEVPMHQSPLVGRAKAADSILLSFGAVIGGAVVLGGLAYLLHRYVSRFRKEDYAMLKPDESLPPHEGLPAGEYQGRGQPPETTGKQ